MVHHLWGYHARVASLGVEQSILDLLGSEAKVSASSQALIASRLYSNDSGCSQRVPRQMTGVHLAAYFGLTEVIMALLKNGHNPNVNDTYDRSPLWWAAEKGREAVVKLLLEKGAELEAKDWEGRTLLSRAAEKGHEAVVKLLLEKGAGLEFRRVLFRSAELDSMDTYGRTPLWLAAENRHEAVVKLLLEQGAELDSKDVDRKSVV